MITIRFIFYLGLYLVLPAAINAQVNSDSLWAIWSDESQPINSRLEAIYLIDHDENEQYRFANNPDTAFYHYQLMYDLAKANDLKIWVGEALLNQGVYFSDRKNNSVKAREYYNKCKVIGEEISDKTLIAKSTYNLGLIDLKKGDFAHGFPFFQQAAKLFEELGRKMLQSRAIDKMAMLLSQQGDLKKSNEYLAKALAIREEQIKINENAMDLMIIAGMKQTIRFQKAQLIIKSDSDSTEKANSIKEIELIKDTFSHLIKEAESTFKNIENKDPNQDKESKQYFLSVGSLSLKAQVFFDKKDTSKAIPFLEEAFLLAKNEGELNSTGWISNALYESYKATGQYKKSLAFFQNTISLRDSLNNIENTKAIIQQEAKAEYEKQKVIDNLKNARELAIEKQKKENQQKLSIAIGIGLLLTSFLTFIIFSRLKLTRQQKSIIEEQKNKVEQSEKYKEQFLANMSHEIRTPMHAISGMINILERNEHPETQDIYLSAMRSSSDNLVVILNDVLDLSKIEAGELDIESIPVKPAAVIENVMQILNYKAEEKGLILTAQIEGDVPSVVMADPTRLNQLLINLVGNAIKFTEKGNIKILLRKVNNQLRFCIKDTGIGISNDKINYIFEAFKQAKSSTNRNYGGTGLGLSISKQLVELQNGKIWVESEEGVGTTFYVDLPIIIAAVDAIKQVHISKDQLKSMAASLKGIRILLAEDNDFNQMIALDDLYYYIEDITIDTVKNGILAVEKFNQNEYDLILMDVQMPEMNGFEASQKIRAIEKLETKGKAISIIAMTASLLKSEVESCYVAGMDNYIPKPYEPEELIGTIYKELIN